MKRILITGGTGTFGKAYLAEYATPQSLDQYMVLSRDELKQYELSQKYPHVRFFLGDIRNLERLRDLPQPDIIIHAAALKQVVAGEDNPTEFIDTNIQGTRNLVRAFPDAKIFLISTDKACYPINLYGATKLAAEKLVLKSGGTVIRYGNVAGSRGSVIPAFLRQAQRGEFEITCREMTRFWFSLPDAISFVRDVIANAKSSEIWIPKLKSFNITALATAMNPSIPQKIIGIRPGEKLHETLMTAEEYQYVIHEDEWECVLNVNISPSAIQKSLSSDKAEFLSVEELKKLLWKLELE